MILQTKERQRRPAAPQQLREAWDRLSVGHPDLWLLTSWTVRRQYWLQGWPLSLGPMVLLFTLDLFSTGSTMDGLPEWPMLPLCEGPAQQRSLSVLTTEENKAEGGVF